MIYELSQHGFTMAVTNELERIYKEHATSPYCEYVDPVAVYNNIKQVYDAIERYRKRISRKNADKHKAYGLLLLDIFNYKVFKHTEYGQKEMDKILAQINKALKK